MENEGGESGRLEVTHTTQAAVMQKPHTGDDCPVGKEDSPPALPRPIKPRRCLCFTEKIPSRIDRSGPPKEAGGTRSLLCNTV